MNQAASRLSASRYSLYGEDFASDRSSAKLAKFFPSDPLVSYRSKRHASSTEFLIRITVDAESVTDLRHIILGCCGGLVTYMRVAPVEHATKMKVWLCLGKGSIDSVISTVMRSLPQAEFGRITPLLSN